MRANSPTVSMPCILHLPLVARSIRPVSVGCMLDASGSDVEQALEALMVERPELRGEAVSVLGGGLDHRAYVVGEFVLRLRADDDDGFDREAALLAAVRRCCAVPVPAPVASGAAWMAYPLLPGVPLLELEPERRACHADAVARTLGGVLAALWATPAEQVAGLVEEDRTPLDEWREEAVALAARFADELPASVRSGVERSLHAPLPAPARTRVFSHNDLGCEHVLVDSQDGRVTGIIDWSDAAIVDPAKDLGLLLRDLGTAAFHRAARAAEGVLATREGLEPRAWLYALCLALEDLAFGLETGRPRYVASAQAALERLTAAHVP